MWEMHEIQTKGYGLNLNKDILRELGANNTLLKRYSDILYMSGALNRQAPKLDIECTANHTLAIFAKHINTPVQAKNVRINIAVTLHKLDNMIYNKFNQHLTDKHHIIETVNNETKFQTFNLIEVTRKINFAEI